jgi:hypothetical protein
MMTETKDLYKENQKTRLRSAICEYMDDLRIDDLMEDMKDILEQEESYFRDRANAFLRFRKLIIDTMADLSIEEQLIDSIKKES